VVEWLRREEKITKDIGDLGHLTCRGDFLDVSKALLTVVPQQ